MIFFNFSFYTIACAVFIILFGKNTKASARAGIIFYTILIVLWLWAVLSFREPTGDPWRYMLSLNYIAKLSFSELFNYNDNPLGFTLLNWVTSTISINSVLFFSVVYFFCVVPLYLAFRERFNKADAAVLIMLYLLYPFYINYLASGFKQGIAFGFMLWGLNCILDRSDPKWFKGLILLFSATLFHQSFWLANIAFAGWYFIYRKRPLSWALSTLGVCIILAMIGAAEPIISIILPQDIITQLGFSSYFDQDFLSSDEYLSVGYISGFRIDFTIFTLLPLLVFFILNKKIKNHNYSIDLLKYYCIIASTYFLMVFIPYSDRIASFSWFLIPFLLFTYLSNSSLNKYRVYFVSLMLISYPLLMLSYVKGFFQ